MMQKMYEQMIWNFFDIWDLKNVFLFFLFSLSLSLSLFLFFFSLVFETLRNLLWDRYYAKTIEISKVEISHWKAQSIHVNFPRICLKSFLAERSTDPNYFLRIQFTVFWFLKNFMGPSNISTCFFILFKLFLSTINMFKS